MVVDSEFSRTVSLVEPDKKSTDKREGFGRPPGIPANGKRIADLRGRCTQEDLAEKATLDVRTIRRAEHGDRLSPEHLGRIASALSEINADPVDIYGIMQDETGYFPREVALMQYLLKWVAWRRDCKKLVATVSRQAAAQYLEIGRRYGLFAPDIADWVSFLIRKNPLAETWEAIIQAWLDWENQNSEKVVPPSERPLRSIERAHLYYIWRVDSLLGGNNSEHWAGQRQFYLNQVLMTLMEPYLYKPDPETGLPPFWVPIKLEWFENQPAALDALEDAHRRRLVIRHAEDGQPIDVSNDLFRLTLENWEQIPPERGRLRWQAETFFSETLELHQGYCSFDIPRFDEIGIFRRGSDRAQWLKSGDLITTGLTSTNSLFQSRCETPTAKAFRIKASDYSSK